jgi:hypothetical protein
MSEQSKPFLSLKTAEPRWLVISVVIPLLWLIFVVTAAMIGGAFGHRVLNAETGVQETVTGLLAFGASVVSLIAFFHPAVKHDWKLRTWLLLFSLAAFFFAGEDLNWGQYYFGWTAPEYFQTHNREHETNLHNMSTWFNQKPRLLAQLWLLIAGVLVPLGWKLPQKLTSRFVPALLWPDKRLVFAAILAGVAKVVSLLVKEEGTHWLATVRWSEPIETFLAYAMLLYALMLLERVRAMSSPRGATSPRRSERSSGREHSRS